jgi:hypothetical protein
MTQRFDHLAYTPKDAMERIAKMIDLWKSHVSILRQTTQRNIIRVTLSSSRQFMDALLKRCMTVLDDNFLKHKNQVMSILKTMQQATRILHASTMMR